MGCYKSKEFSEKQSLEVIMTQCKYMKMMKVVPVPQTKTIGFVCTESYWGFPFGKSGPIKCVKGFKVVFTLRQPGPGESG